MSRDRWETDGDWTADPWFLRTNEALEPEWESLGLPREKRQLAAQGLARIFPPDVCRSIRDAPNHRGFGPVILLFGMYGTFTHMIAPLLILGINAMAANPWEDPSVLLRLQRRRSFKDTEFEVRVHAGLVRAGFQVTRVPESSKEKRHDFLASQGSVTYEVEVKLVNASDLDELAEELNEQLRRADFVIPGLSLELRGSEKLSEETLEDRDGVKRKFSEIVSAFAEVGKRLRETPLPGTYEAGEYGHIVAKKEEGFGGFTDLTLPDLPEEKKASRVARKVRDGLAQMTRKHIGVVVVGVFHSAHPFMVERSVVELMAKSGDRGPIGMAVLCDSLDVPPPPQGYQRPGLVTGWTPTFHAFSTRAYRQLRKKDLSLAAAAASTHDRPAVQLRPGQPGELALTMNTNRPKKSVRSVGSMSIGPGQSGTMYFDGRPPVIKDNE